MRELVFSVGITFLTGTLLFVYFRNKISNIDRKVNMVFETIQEHNSRMQVEAQEEMKRFQMFHEQQMQMRQHHEEQQHNPHTGQHSDEPTEQMRSEPNNLIDVSDQESDLSDMSDDESSDDDNSDNSDDDTNKDDVEKNPEVVTLSDNVENPSDNNLTDLLNSGLTEVNVENISPLDSNVELNNDELNDDEEDEDLSNGLEIMEEKLSSKTSDTLVNYNKYTKAQLRNICEEKGFTGWKSLNKGKLVTFLENQ